MSTPTFPKRDPAEPAFWDQRYHAGFAPWDAGRAPAQLSAFIARTCGPRAVLVPGCGSGWDVRAFAEAGWDVLGLDFSPEAVDAARTVLGPHAACAARGDVFAPIEGSPFDLVYERAFLCALPRRLWSDWGARMGELVGRGGMLAGFFFFDEGERGPPFPLHSQEELGGLLGEFDCIDDAPVADSIDVFRGKERWQVWRRR